MPLPVVLKSKIVLDEFFQVKEDYLKFPNQKAKYYTVVPRAETVSILALTKNNKIILNQEYRHPLRKVIYDLPAGYVKRGEKPRQAALRELKEETGYKALKIKKLGSFYALAGITTMKIHLFQAEHLVKVAQQRLDKTEFIKNKFIPLEELKKKILENQIKDLPLAFAFLFYLMKKEKSLHF